MNRLRIPFMTLVVIAAVIGVRYAGTGDDLTARPASDSQILEYLGEPEGPFDPVLTQPVPRGRAAPPMNRVVNDPTDEEVSIVQSEVSIAVDGDYIVVGWNDGIAFVDGSTVSGYGYSTDRGESWTDGGEVPEGSGTAVYGDPTVIVTNDDEWLYMSLDQGSPLGLALNRARFNGGHLIWDPAEKYSDNNNFIDKEFLEYDAATNMIYLTYTIGTGRLSTSNDNGHTWSTPLTIAGGSNPNGFYPAPGVDGEVYVSWMNPLGQGNARLYARHSSDSGQSWSCDAVQVVQLSAQSGYPPRCFNRSFNVTFPAMSVDRSDGPHRGRAYFVFTDGMRDEYDVFFTYSDDKALTWAPIVQLNDNENETEQFWPQIHVGPFGRVSVTWYDRRNETDDNSICDMYVTQSVDGGATWGPNRRVSDTSVAWCGVPANISPNFGDYIEMTSDDRSVFAVWSDAREGGPDVIFGRYDDRHLLAVTGEVGGSRTEITGDGTAWFIPNEAEIVIDPDPDLESQAELLVPSLAMGLLATPQETNGIWQLSGEELSGHVTLSSSLGDVGGAFSIARSGDNTIDFDFTSSVSDGLVGQMFLPTWTTDVTFVDGGAGQVNFFGTATLSRLLGTVSFTLSGAVNLDGAPDAVLAANQGMNQFVKLTTDAGTTLHTRTMVEDDLFIPVDAVSLGDNPPPLGTVRATPNPLERSTVIAYTLTHEAVGSIRIYAVDGRLVRTVAEGRFEAGSHTIPFDGRDDAGRPLAMGGYFIKMQTDMVNVGAKLFVVR